jgi:ABC-type antimicrobial peptide transport system permease subunit
MLRHSLLMICRNFLRFKGTFFINLLGLSTGLACTLLIYLWVHDELKVDKFHEKDGRLFQVLGNQPHSGGIITTDGTASMLAEKLAEEIPEIEYAAVSTPPSWFKNVALSSENKRIKATAVFVGKDYFNIFSYNLIQGDKSQVLKDKNGLMISKQLALKLFDTTQDIIGKTLNWQLDHFKKQSIIVGILEDLPASSSVQFDFVLPFEAFTDLVPGMPAWDDNGPFFSYVILKEGADLKQVNTKITNFIKTKSKDTLRTSFLKRYSDNYLYGTYENGIQTGGRIEYVKLFSLIALFILLIACINFMNLSTAKASRRIKEVGIKKAFGAGRRILVLQYLGESMLVSIVSLLLALVIVALWLPQFNTITGKELNLQWSTNLLCALLAITFLTGLLSGSYPAFYLSSFNPIAILKGGGLGKFSTAAGELWARKGLVIFQFTLSIVFVVSVLVVYKQIDYVQTKKLGYDKDHVISFESEGKVPESMNTFLAEIKNIPGVINASSMVGHVLGGPSVGIPCKAGGTDAIIQFRPMLANYDLIETLGIEMAVGRAFSKSFGGDSARIILNESAVKALGLEDPVGKQFRGKEIIGVVKDFHFQSLHEEVKPLFITLDNLTGTVLVKLEAGKEKEALYQLQQFYAAYNPGFTFDYRFLDADYQALYVAEQRVSTLSRYFAGLAILISCLGLLGLAAFTAERRRKEMGIRKVLGASEWSLITLISGEFAKLLLISMLIALPVSYFLTKHWLESFAYRIELTPWYFLGAALLTICTALFTVGTQALKAAKVNPVPERRIIPTDFLAEV